MVDDALVQLIRRAPLSVLGTIEHLGAATMTNIPIDGLTAVVRVDRVLHSPREFAGLQGQRITIQLAADAGPLAIGSQAAFFVEGVAVGESLAVRELGRLPVESLEPRLAAAAEAGRPDVFADLKRRAEEQRLREHAATAEAAVVGQVVRLETATGLARSEHDPEWWRATLRVLHVERGDLEAAEVQVLYANSLDVRWYLAPKPRAAQRALWLLHATAGELRELAPFQILHSDDCQPVHQLTVLRANGG